MVRNSKLALRTILNTGMKSCILAGILAGPFQSALPQQQATATPHDPNAQKIGLVLEGGGALGLAHIGVITWLEEHHIPVSYVAGTSMGGLVGGVYATGRSPSEVRTLVESINWNDVLRGQVPFQNLTFRRKQDSVVYPGSIEFGIKKGVQFPSGFNSGQEVQFILDRVALPYSTIQNFDQLPIPYGCVATDLDSGKKYVFSSGSFATAMRSTMSLPGFFSPVRTDGHLFADGGLLDNLPVDVAKQMGAAITIAVYLDTQGAPKPANLSSFGVLGKAISVMIAANEVQSMEAADVLVSVPLAKYNTMDYSQSDDLIKAGYDAAQSKAAVLSKFSVDDATWKQYLADRDARRRHTPKPEFIEVAGTDPHSAKAIQKDFQPELNQDVNSDLMQKKILDIQGDGRFASLNYSMVDKDGKPGLLIDATEKSYAPPIIRPQITLDGSQYNNVLFSLGARITFLNVGTYDSELRNDVVVGSEYGLRTEYYHPLLVGSRWFVAPQVLLDSNQFNAYTNTGSLASIYRVKQAGGALDFGYQLGRSQEFRLGYASEYLSYTLQVGEDTEPTVSGRDSYMQFQYNALHTDDPVIPTTGQLANFNTRWYNAYPSIVSSLPTPDFFGSSGAFSQFVPFSEKNTFVVGFGAGTIYNSDPVRIGLPIYNLGGPRLFAAYGTNEILTNNYGYGQLSYLRQLAQLPPFLGGKLYFIGRLEAGTYQNAENEFRRPVDGVGGFIVNTIFGPVLIGGAGGDAGHYRFFFQMGRVF
jgi:NTE family protein